MFWRKKQTTKPRFILGVGCQKGGTAWLYNYLKSRRDVAMSPTKEMHVFDRHFRPDLAIEIRGAHAGTPMLANLELYRQYFLNLARRTEVVGEITPAYAILDAAQFQWVRGFLKPDFDPRVVFVMRDPVDRLWSAARMYAGRSRSSPVEQFAKDLDNPKTEARTRYEATIPALEAAFAQDELFLQFFEQLFQEKSISAFCSFVGLPYRRGKYAVKRHAAGDDDATLPADLAKRAREYYSATYDFCSARFGEALIRSIWRYA